MWFFTKQERLAIIVIGLVVSIGIVAKFLLLKYPQLDGIVNAIDSNHLYSKININTATYDELVRIPYIGPSTARAMIAFRDEHGLFSHVDEIKSLPPVRLENFNKFKSYLIIQ